MTRLDFTYEDALRKIMLDGVDRGDRTGTGTRSLFGLQMRWNLAEGFPLVTTKQVYTRPMVEELLWMLSGSTDNNVLKAKNVKIWDAWADPATGELGPIYGRQWRSWPSRRLVPNPDYDGPNPNWPEQPPKMLWDTTPIDQLANVVRDIKANPESRRHVVSAWNVADLPDMALAPCHCLFQFWVANGKLSCQLYQRSADMFLGVPFNIASYALLTHMVAQQCNLQVGEFIWTGGDCHIYNNHFDQTHMQLTRTPYPLPTLLMSPGVKSIFDYELGDVVFHDYQHHPAIKGEVAV